MNKQKAIIVLVERWYRGKPKRLSLWWAGEKRIICSINNSYALNLASQIYNLQKGKPKKKT